MVVNRSHIRKKKFKTSSKKKEIRPKRYMNAFLCFCHEERAKFKNGLLLQEWRNVHKGLGKKWNTLNEEKNQYNREGNVPPFAMFIKEDKQRSKLLPEWIRWHRGLGEKWQRLDQTLKARYKAASSRMKNAYEMSNKKYKKSKLQQSNFTQSNEG